MSKPAILESWMCWITGEGEVGWAVEDHPAVMTIREPIKWVEDTGCEKIEMDVFRSIYLVLILYNDTI